MAKILTVYHSSEWCYLVENGWITWSVENGQALMFKVN